MSSIADLERYGCDVRNNLDDAESEMQTWRCAIMTILNDRDDEDFRSDTTKAELDTAIWHYREARAAMKRWRIELAEVFEALQES